MSKSTYTTQRHMSVNIEGMLRNFGVPGKKNYSSMAGIFQDENGKEMSDANARIFLHNAKLKGWKKIPCGNCEGFDYFGGGCPGHPITKKEYEKSRE